MTEDSGSPDAGAELAARAALVAHGSPDGMVLTDGFGTVTWSNDAASRLLGYGIGELVGVNIFELLDEDEQHLAGQAVSLIVAEPDHIEPAIYHPLHHDGHRVPIEINGAPVVDAEGRPGLVLNARSADHHSVLTKGVSRLSEGAELDAVVKDVLDDLTDRWGGYHALLVIFDEQRRIIGSAPAPLADLLLAPSPDDGLPWECAFHLDRIVFDRVDHLPAEAADVLRALDIVGVLAVPVPDPDGPRACLVLAADSTAPFLLETFWKQSPTFLLLRFAIARRYWVSRLQEAASTDPLTGLANRATFFHALESHRDESRQIVAVLYVDLDDFKPVNDRFGHAVGDTVLTTVAQRLEATVRPGDIVSRFGGDELAVLCRVEGEAAATQIADRLLAAVRQPIEVAGTTVELSTSIGIALGDATEESVDALIERADHALYEAKASGKGQWVVADGSPA